MPASGVLNAAAIAGGTARPAPARARSSIARQPQQPAQRVHDRRADLHRRSLAPDRGAAHRPEQRQHHLADGDAQRQHGVDGLVRSCAAPRSSAECRCPARPERRAASAAPRTRARPARAARQAQRPTIQRSPEAPAPHRRRLAKAIATSATSTAPPQNTSRRSHSRGESSGSAPQPPQPCGAYRAAHRHLHRAHAPADRLPCRRRAACRSRATRGRRNWPACRRARASLDQRTRANGRAGRRGPKRDQPVAAVRAGPKAASAAPSARKRAAHVGRAQRRGCRSRRSPRGGAGSGGTRDPCARPRSPRPWAMQRQPAPRAARPVRRRRRRGCGTGGPRRARAAVAEASRGGSAVPRGRRCRAASRRFTAPSRGARANTITVSFTRRAGR